jgi:glucose/arabinose dehydrogenase
MNPRDKIGPALEAAKRGTRKACTFRQRDLAAALRAAKQTGHDVREILIDPDGKICLVTGAPEPTAEPVAPAKQAEQVWLDLARKRS